MDRRSVAIEGGGAPVERDADSSRSTAIRLPSAFSAFGDGSPVIDLRVTVRDLAKAIEGSELQVRFQSEFSAVDRTIRGCESLVRWYRPNGDVLGPNQFIPLAEESGLVVPLGAFVMRESLILAAQWTGPLEGAFVGVNVSRLQLDDPEFADIVERSIVESGIDPTRVLLEITETAAFVNPERALQTLLELRSMGLRIAIDDFGTGQSSLVDLYTLPIDVVKIAEPLVTGAIRNERALIVLENTIDLLHQLGMEVVAEGIESEAHAVLATQLGCDYLQGYHLSRPTD